MIVDLIDSGDLESAKDYIGQFKDYLHNKEIAIQQQDPRHNQEPLMVTGLATY